MNIARWRMRFMAVPLPVGVMLGAVLGSQALTQGQVLFDGEAGSLPADQGWAYFASGTATQILTNGAVLLDTSTSGTTQAGYALLSPVPLNRTNGFTLSFTVQLHGESHLNTNRAGFSLIVLDNDLRGVELGFWEDRIFAQSDSPLFVHAEESTFATTDSPVEYRLSLFTTNYLLRAGGEAILRGPVRDYTKFSGFPNLYRTPNFLFLGDDTTSAEAVASIREVVLFTPPVLRIIQPGVISWQGVPGKSYVVQSSLDLVTWGYESTVTAVSGVSYFTNVPVGEVGFLRVEVP